MISKKTILFIGDPYCVHNLKWITFFSANNRCIIIGEINHIKNITESSLEIIKKNQLILCEEFLPEFSLKHIIRTRRAQNRLNKIITDQKIDFVHVLYATNLPWISRIKVPVVLTTRGSDVLIDLPHFFTGLSGRIWSYVYSRAIKNLSFITCTSEQQINRMHKLFSFFEKENIHLIRTGVDVEKIAALGKELHLKRDTNRIFLARYISSNYNNELILQAIQLLPESVRINITLVMIKPVQINQIYLDKIIKLANTLNCKIELKERLSQEEMWAEYFKAGLCVMTPLSDGTPNTAFEAMSSECPLILPPINYDKGLFDDVTIQLKTYDPTELKNLIEKQMNGTLEVNTKEAFRRVQKEGNRIDQMTTLSILYEKILMK